MIMPRRRIYGEARDTDKREQKQACLFFCRAGVSSKRALGRNLRRDAGADATGGPSRGEAAARRTACEFPLQHVAERRGLANAASSPPPGAAADCRTACVVCSDSSLQRRHRVKRALRSFSRERLRAAALRAPFIRPADDCAIVPNSPACSQAASFITVSYTHLTLPTNSA